MAQSSEKSGRLGRWVDLGDQGVWLGDQALDADRWCLRAAAAPPATEGQRLDSAQQVLDCAARAGSPIGLRHLVVGVIGPREATDTQYALAEALGRRLATLTVTTLCGGRSGVMEAVCKGVATEGGLSLGLLPGTTPADANPFVGIPLPTGLSEGRNMVIARAARVLVAIGGSYGTLTEIAYGLHFGKTVIGLDTAPEIDGVVRATDQDDAIALVCEALLREACF